jgi:protocatechuate 3,4-dioxygenase alpha subunit
MSVPATASQTVGPYFSIGLSYRNSIATCAEATEGEHIEISGQVFDGEGVPVPDAQLELWQADAKGRFAGLDPSDPSEHGPASPGFQGFARVPTNEEGAFHLHTVRPGAVTGPSGTLQAPHIVVLLSMRGLLRHLFTRIYFSNEPLNTSDPVLLAIPPERRPTLFAQPIEGQPQSYRLDIRLQGENETVFFMY